MFNSNHAFLLVQKLKSALSAKIALGVKAKKEMDLFNLPQVTNKC
jgi:hypothetical protein